MLEPDEIIGLIWANQTMATLVFGEVEMGAETATLPGDAGMRAAGIESNNMVENMQLYLFAVFVFTITLAFLYMLTRMRCAEGIKDLVLTMIK